MELIELKRNYLNMLVQQSIELENELEGNERKCDEMKLAEKDRIKRTDELLKTNNELLGQIEVDINNHNNLHTELTINSLKNELESQNYMLLKQKFFDPKFEEDLQKYLKEKSIKERQLTWTMSEIAKTRSEIVRLEYDNNNNNNNNNKSNNSTDQRIANTLKEQSNPKANSNANRTTAQLLADWLKEKSNPKAKNRVDPQPPPQPCQKVTTPAMTKKRAKTTETEMAPENKLVRRQPK